MLICMRFSLSFRVSRCSIALRELMFSCKLKAKLFFTNTFSFLLLRVSQLCQVRRFAGLPQDATQSKPHDVGCVACLARNTVCKPLSPLCAIISRPTFRNASQRNSNRIKSKSILISICIRRNFASHFKAARFARFSFRGAQSSAPRKLCLLAKQSATKSLPECKLRATNSTKRQQSKKLFAFGEQPSNKLAN